MMGIVMPETCWTYKTYNKITSGFIWFFILQLYLIIPRSVFFRMRNIFIQICIENQNRHFVFNSCFVQNFSFYEIIIIIIIIIFLHGLSRLTCSGIDALPLFPGASKISSSSGFVVEGRVSAVWCCPFSQGDWSKFVCICFVHLLFQESVVLSLCSYLIQPCVSRNTS